MVTSVLVTRVFLQIFPPFAILPFNWDICILHFLWFFEFWYLNDHARKKTTLCEAKSLIFCSDTDIKNRHIKSHWEVTLWLHVLFADKLKCTQVRTCFWVNNKQGSWCQQPSHSVAQRQEGKEWSVLALCPGSCFINRRLILRTCAVLGDVSSYTRQARVHRLLHSFPKRERGADEAELLNTEGFCCSCNITRKVVKLHTRAMLNNWFI